jgi:hypothetical protein
MQELKITHLYTLPIQQAHSTYTLQHVLVNAPQRTVRFEIDISGWNSTINDIYYFGYISSERIILTFC